MTAVENISGEGAKEAKETFPHGPRFWSTPARAAALRNAITPWLGTPFMESCGAKARPGVQADCCWVAKPLQQLGAVGAVPWPARYVSRGGGLAMLDILIGVLDGVERLLCLWTRGACSPAPADLLPGDVLVFSAGTRLHHLALYLGDNTIVHSWNGLIGLGNAHDQREKLLWALYRPIEL